MRASLHCCIKLSFIAKDFAQEKLTDREYSELNVASMSGN